MISTILTLLVVVLATESSAGDVGFQDGKAPAADELFAQAKALSSREEWENAVTRFREFLGKHPDDPRASEARFWIGFSLVKSDEFAEAVSELESFEQGLAKDKWADDALLQLGHAYRGQDDNQRALGAWKLLLEKHADSVWRTEAALQIIDLLLHAEKDYAACLPYCERVTRETADLGSITEARYAGAYCLNALSRYDEASRWTDRWLSSDSAIEAGWRRLLLAQRDLRQGRPEEAFKSLESLNDDFPDLDRGDRLDLTLRVATMLSRENHTGRARDLVVAAMKNSAGDSEDEITALLDQLAETTVGDRAFRDALERLAGDQGLPLMARVGVRNRQVQALREDEHFDQAESLLRDALAKEKAEYARFRAATLLAELLNEDQDDRSEAMKVLNEVLPGLRRNDLVHEIRKAIKELQSSPEEERE
jgi:tetratricopeptide (TPR) repeat protein